MSHYLSGLRLQKREYLYAHCCPDCGCYIHTDAANVARVMAGHRNRGNCKSAVDGKRRREEDAGIAWEEDTGDGDEGQYGDRDEDEQELDVDLRGRMEEHLEELGENENDGNDNDEDDHHAFVEQIFNGIGIDDDEEEDDPYWVLENDDEIDREEEEEEEEDQEEAKRRAARDMFEAGEIR